MKVIMSFLAMLAISIFATIETQARIRVIKLEDCGNGHFAWAVVSDENRPDGRFTMCDVVNCDGSITNYMLGLGQDCSIGMIPPGSPVDSVVAWLPLSGASIGVIGYIPSGGYVDSIDVGPETLTSTGFVDYARLLTKTGVEICRIERTSGEAPTSTCNEDLQ